MRLITVLISLGVEHFYPQLAKWRDVNWWSNYQGWWAKHLAATNWWNAITAILFPLLPIMIAVILVRCLLGTLLFGLFGYLFDAIVLWYLLRNTWITEPQYDGAVFCRAHEQRFAILFWFFVLGIWAAVLYRVVSWMVNNAKDENSPYYATLSLLTQSHQLIAWIPARLTALSYALVGNFTPAFSIWQQQAWQKGGNSELLINCGEAALEEQDNNAVELLIKRVLLLWLLALALVTIGMLV